MWCRAGYDCTGGGESICSTGEYSLYRQKTCTNCPAGHYCKDVYSRPLPCRPNEFAAAGQTACTVCANEEFSFEGWESCETVQPGFLAKNSNGGNFLVRSTGFGRYAHNSRNDRICNEGKFCPQYSTSASEQACPAGHYCHEEDAATYINPVPCPAGTFQSSTSNNNRANDCSACTDGFYCPPGTVDPIECPAGFYCDKNEATYSPQGEPAPCADGTFSAAGQKTCAITCPDGYECRGGFQYFCPAGSFCSGGTVSPVSSGSYSPLFGLTTDSAVTCPLGATCPDTGMAFPTPCPHGQY